MYSTYTARDEKEKSDIVNMASLIIFNFFDEDESLQISWRQQTFLSNPQVLFTFPV